MPDGLQETVVAEILRPLVAFFAGREGRRTLENAGKLHFWSDGMVHELKIIRDGGGDADTFATLERKYKESKPVAGDAMDKLREARNRLGGGPVARAIDECLSAEAYGKRTIHMSISSLLKQRPDDPSVSARAQTICNDIEALNAALERLRRLIED